MKVVAMKCPSCGGSFDVEEGRKDCYCQFCGEHIFLDDEVKKSEKTFAFRNDTKIRKMELEAEAELLRLKQQIKDLEEAKVRAKSKNGLWAITFGFLALALLSFCIIGFGPEVSEAVDDICRMGMIIGNVGFVVMLMFTIVKR